MCWTQSCLTIIISFRTPGTKTSKVLSEEKGIFDYFIISKRVEIPKFEALKKRSYISSKISTLKVGMAYVFFFLFLNASFSSAYKLIIEDSFSSSLDIGSDAQKSESESEAKGMKELNDISEEYFLFHDDLSLTNSGETQNQYIQNIFDHLSHFPEKDSPPPKSIIV